MSHGGVIGMELDGTTGTVIGPRLDKVADVHWNWAVNVLIIMLMYVDTHFAF